MMKRYVLPLMLAVMAGCSETGIVHITDGDGAGLLRLKVAQMQGDVSADTRIDDVSVYRFGDGVLEEVVMLQPAGAGNIYSLEMKDASSEMYVLANSSALEAAGSLVPGESTLEDFLSMEASAAEMTSAGFLMTGRFTEEDLDRRNVPVTVTRSVARLDILSTDKDVRVLGVKVTGLAGKGPVDPGRSGTMAQAADEKSASVDNGEVFFRDFSENPLQNGRESLLYMVVQKGTGAVAEVTAESGGALHRFSTALPASVRRNTVYTLVVHGNGTGISVSVTDGDWEQGGTSGSGPSLLGIVDVENSILPEGVLVSPSGDTVRVSYTGRDFVLALLAEPSAEVSVNGQVSGVEVTAGQPVLHSLVGIASVSVSSSLRMPGTPEERIYLDIHDGDVTSGRVVLLFEASPVEVDGILAFDGNGVCDFGRYVDGELAVISVPQDKVLDVEFPEGEDAWMKAVEVTGTSGSDGTSGKRIYRLLGGWRPNDPKADGREQSGFVVISNTDGTDREAYTVKRLNWGLPVVKMGETWWCRYNLRGNVKDFRDQITCGKDPAAQNELFTMLQEMPADDLQALMGDQYQAGNLNGLPLMHDGSGFLYDGMKPSAQNFGLLDPEVMAPDGYMIPAYEDYAFFAANDNFNIGGIGERSFSNRTGQRLYVRIAERKVSFLGHDYGTVAFYDFEYEGSRWTLFGLGHQWNPEPGNIAGMNILLATYGHSGRTWAMEGYASTDKKDENWLKFADNNSTKTRTIRCVKIPVEYIY